MQASTRIGESDRVRNRDYIWGTYEGPAQLATTLISTVGREIIGRGFAFVVKRERLP